MFCIEWLQLYGQFSELRPRSSSGIHLSLQTKRIPLTVHLGYFATRSHCNNRVSFGRALLGLERVKLLDFKCCISKCNLLYEKQGLFFWKLIWASFIRYVGLLLRYFIVFLYQVVKSLSFSSYYYLHIVFRRLFLFQNRLPVRSCHASILCIEDLSSIKCRLFVFYSYYFEASVFLFILFAARDCKLHFPINACCTLWNLFLSLTFSYISFVGILQASLCSLYPGQFTIEKVLRSVSITTQNYSTLLKTPSFLQFKHWKRLLKTSIGTDKK